MGEKLVPFSRFSRNRFQKMTYLSRSCAHCCTRPPKRLEPSRAFLRSAAVPRQRSCRSPPGRRPAPRSPGTLCRVSCEVRSWWHSTGSSARGRVRRRLLSCPLAALLQVSVQEPICRTVSICDPDQGRIEAIPLTRCDDAAHRPATQWIRHQRNDNHEDHPERHGGLLL